MKRMSEKTDVDLLRSMGIWKRSSGFALTIAVGMDMFAKRLLVRVIYISYNGLARKHPPCPWDTWACKMAAMNGRLDVLQWMRSQTTPCPWNEWACANAARNGHLDVLQWLRTQTPPCPWNAWACAYAAKNGHLDALQSVERMVV